MHKRPKKIFVKGIPSKVSLTIKIQTKLIHRRKRFRISMKTLGVEILNDKTKIRQRKKCRYYLYYIIL